VADWKSLQIQVPGKDLLAPAANVLEQLLMLLEVLKAILDTIKVFLIDFGNPIKALVDALISLIEELFLSLKATGVYGLFHVPNPVDDPNFANHRGFDAFTEVFKESLFDSKDPNRPQPRQGSTVGGFVLLVVTADAPFGLLGKIKQLLKFFNREFSSPRYEAPQNLKAAPLGPDGDPILSISDVFTMNPEKLGLTWDLSTSSETPDNGFNDVISRVAHEFVPSNFLIEKSTINPSAEVIDVKDIKNPDVAGKVEQAVSKSIAGTSSRVTQRQLLRDTYDDLVIKFTKYIVLDSFLISSLIGQLGRMRWVDDDVEPDTTYYYRVRAFSGDLAVTSNGQIDFAPPAKTQGRSDPCVKWPSTSTDPDSECVMGKASGIIAIRVPAPLSVASFAVVENLRRVFQAAFTCDFHRFRDVNSTPLTGEGSLVKLAGAAARYSSQELVAGIRGAPGDTISAQISNLPALEFPWEARGVRRQSARLADTVASALLEGGSSTTETFRSLMQTPNSVLNEATLEAAVFALTETEDVSDDVQASAFLAAYEDEPFRTALLEVTGFLKTFTGGGTPPDWIALSPLRDIVPWSGEVIYSLLDKIQSLVDAFNGVAKELNDFIDLLTRKIDTLERLLESLVSVLDFIESLQIGAYVLVVPEVNGTAVDWVRTVDEAGGTRPPSGPGGYSGGVALSYVASDVTAFKTAFSLIFGA
jgi:hypothetical protein